MSTVIRPELSKRNKYYISKHRYYELRHFCLQYPDWKKKYLSLCIYTKSPYTLSVRNHSYIPDPTKRIATERVYYKERMDMVEKCAKEAGGDLSDYLFKAVTEGLGYNKIYPPCCKEVYYDIYRKFFWLLSNTRE